jgi:spore coat polysaccharide biosynthesis protein SpsF
MLKPGLSAIHDGADPMSRWALDKLVLKAHDDPVAREHVSAYFKLHPEFVKVAQIDLPLKWQFKGARLSVDTPADVTFIEAIYERLHAQAGEATLTDLVALLNREPALLELNGHVQQKAVTAQSGTIIVRCDGGGVVGLGHVKRCLSLARRLRDAHGFGVRFAMAPDKVATEPVTADGFEIDLRPHGVDECDWLLALIDKHHALSVVLDIRTNLSPTSVMRLRGAGAIVGVIDDASQRRLCADFAVYPPVPQVFALNWEGAENEPLVGWEWVILGQEVGYPMRAGAVRPRVLISMGGTDPLALTLPAVDALAKLPPTFNATVVIGPGAPPHLESEIGKVAPRFEIIRAPNDLPRLMAEADLGVISFGVTAYELAALGVPALYLCLTPDHALSASAFEAAGMGISLGVAGEINDMMIAGAVQSLLSDAARRRAMSAAGRMNLDGRGAARVAERIARLIDEKREVTQTLPQPRLQEAS